MNDIAANLTDLLDKTIGVFAAGLAGGVGLALGLRAAGWKPNPGATVNVFDVREGKHDSLYAQPGRLHYVPGPEDVYFNEPKHLVPVQTNLDVLMKAIKFDDELLTEHEIRLLQTTIREAIQTLCPLAFRLTSSKELYTWCCKDHRKCGVCWKGEHRRD